MTAQTMGTSNARLGQGWLFHERFGFAYDRIPPALAFEAYGKALLICARGDEEISDNERRWVVGYFAAFNSPDEVTDALKSFDGRGDVAEMIAMANTQTSVPYEGRNWLVWDALAACTEDGYVTEGEHRHIRAMAEAAGVPPETITELQEVFNEEQALKERKMKLLWPNGIPGEYR
jgi:hypothetical protein